MNKVLQEGSKRVAVYHSLEHVIEALTSSQKSAKDLPIEILKLLEIGVKRGTIHAENESYFPSPRPRLIKIDEDQNKNRAARFIVMEGLDGSGKTTLTNKLSEKFGFKLMSTPPEYILPLRNYFDSQNESIRRAYYSIGNYMVAQEIESDLSSNTPIIMDRFWHSTAAYAYGNLMKSQEWSGSEDDICWPKDLLKPDLVIFLKLSEEERVKRHQNRRINENGTNSNEEKLLASDQQFRVHIREFYEKIVGPTFHLLNVDGSPEECLAAASDCLKTHFPDMN